MCKRMCLGGPRAELREGAVKSLSLQSESPLSPRPFPLTIGISWVDDLALFLLFVYSIRGKASLTGYSSLSFSPTTHYLSFLSTDCRAWLAASYRVGGPGTAQTDSEVASEQKDHSPYALAASFGQCILHIRPRADRPAFFPYQLLLLPSTMHGPGRKARLAKEQEMGPET